MLIKEVCERCSLTKKAIEYYEKQGLVKPEKGKNGYRNYQERDIIRLKEIYVLRSLGLSIKEIKDVFTSGDKSLTLAKYKYLTDLQKQRMEEQAKGMQLLIDNYNIENGIDYINTNLKNAFTIKEKLVQCFPGVYGVFLSTHFGPFLNEKIDSKEKEEAFINILEFLDRIDLDNEIAESLKNIIFPIEQEDVEKMNETFINAVDNIDNYMTTNQQAIEKYINFRKSDAYRSSPAYKTQKSLKAFQQTSGYDENFITNLKILSLSYREYMMKLQNANELFIKKFPQVEKLYDND